MACKIRSKENLTAFITPKPNVQYIYVGHILAPPWDGISEENHADPQRENRAGYRRKPWRRSRNSNRAGGSWSDCLRHRQKRARWNHHVRDKGYPSVNSG